MSLKDLFISYRGNLHKPGFLHNRFVCYFVVIILTFKIISIVMYIPLPQNFFFANITTIDLLNLLNENRQNLGLHALAENEALNKAAMEKAKDMVKNSYFAHESPQGVTPWFWFKKVGYAYKYAGENLAVGFADSKTVYDAWYNSPSHKANLLNKNYTEVGTAVLAGFDGNSIVVVQEFGSPLKPQTTSPKQTPIPKTENPTPAPVKPVPSTPEPEPVLVQENGVSNVIPLVLPATTEYIVGPEYGGTRSFYMQFLNFVVYHNGKILQYASLGTLFLILFCLIINGIFIFNPQNRVMLLQSLLLIAILGISLILNKDMASELLPYQVMI